MASEAEGSVFSRPGGRHVIEPTDEDVRDIDVLHWTPKKLAADLAAAHTSLESRQALRARPNDLGEATASGDPNACTRCDMAQHRTIWEYADNPHLLCALDSVLGAIFVVCDRTKARGRPNAQQILEEHRHLVDLIKAGDSEGAGRTIEALLKKRLPAALRPFQVPRREPTGELVARL